MEMFINSSYLITIGTLIGYERTVRCKELTSKEDKEKYRQIPFCTGICCVQTYRKIEKAVLEVKVPIYMQLLDKLGFQMHYDDAIYKDINYRLRNLNDAIEKYDLDSVFLIVEKLNGILADHHDIYYVYLRRILDVIYQYYKCNEFPSIDDVTMMKSIFVGFPIYVRDIMIDILFKYGMQNIIDADEFKLFVNSIGVYNNKYIPNQINNLLYYCYLLNYERFYNEADLVISQLNKKAIHIRLLDIYDLKITADLNANPTKILNDITLCEDNVKELMKKIKIDSDNPSIENLPSMTKRKFAQHYYHLGYALMMMKEYKRASIQFEKSLLFDDVFEVLCKVSLFSCFDHMNYKTEEYKDYIYLNRKYDLNNKNFIIFQYFGYKYKEKDNRKRLRYLRKYVLEHILKEDTVLVRILFYEVNILAKSTTNYQILQEFIEKMGIVG